MAVTRLALVSGSHAVESTHNLHPCHCGFSVYVTIISALGWLKTEAR